MAEGETKEEKRKIMITVADSGGCCDDDLSPDLREGILKTVGEALSGRENVVTTRLNDETLERIDALVEIELFKSRSEATAFFIAEGMNSRGDLFERVMPTMEKIRQLKEELKQSLK
jgi:hypothetical protein